LPGTNTLTYRAAEYAIKKKKKKFHNIDTCGLYYKHIAIVNYDSSMVKKFGASLTDDARVIIYDRHLFIVQATGVNVIKMSSSLTLQQNTLED
jgi:hypothetical protein